MAVTVYKSSDASAPSLSGSAGALLSVLDACLVDGYGALSGAGWAKAFTGTNKRVYRAPSGNRYYLRVDDTGTTSAAVDGYETMSDVDTGTNMFPPSNVTFSITKSNTASVAARAWVLITTSTFFYLFIDIAENPFSTQFYYGSAFGDFYSYKPGDVYNTILVVNDLAQILNLYVGKSNNAFNSRVARRYDGIAIGTAIGKMPILNPIGDNYNIAGYENAFAYPEPVSGNLIMTPILLIEYSGVSNSVLRGWLPGLWSPVHATPLTNADTFTGNAGIVNGKSFLVLKVQAPAPAGAGQLFIETSDTWLDTPVL